MSTDSLGASANADRAVGPSDPRPCGSRPSASIPGAPVALPPLPLAVMQRRFIEGSDDSNAGWYDVDDVVYGTPLMEEYEPLFTAGQMVAYALEVARGLVPVGFVERQNVDPDGKWTRLVGIITHDAKVAHGETLYAVRCPS